MLLTGLLREEDFEAAKEKALKIGASKCYVEERRKKFITELIYPSIQCNSIYENVYLLGIVHYLSYFIHAYVVQERPSLVRSSPVASVAQKEGCFAVSHGCGQ